MVGDVGGEDVEERKDLIEKRKSQQDMSHYFLSRA